MAKFYKAETQKKIEETGLIPLFFSADTAVSRDVARSIFASGCPILELTNRGEGAIDSFKAIAQVARTEYPEAAIGVGSVSDPYIAAQFLAIGADFIVGPCFNEELARLCNRHQVLYLPGCATVTEIMTAVEVGLDLIKIFPAGALGGPGFIKAVRGPIPWLKTVPTGGVDTSKENLTEWFDANVAAVGLGSNLISKQVLASRDYDSLKKATEELLKTISELLESRKSKQ